MKARLLIFAGFLLCVSTGLAVTGQTPAAGTPAPVAVTTTGAGAAAPEGSIDRHQRVLAQYCVICHNHRMNLPAGAPLYLDTADLAEPGRDAEIWEKVVRKLAVGAMPPQGLPAPPAEDLRELRSWLVRSLDRAAAATVRPGRYVIHRLNRTEYYNAIRDLLALDITDSDLLPGDGGGFGFDNVAAALTSSPGLVERYATTAMRVAALAVGDTQATASNVSRSIPVEVTQNDHVEDLPIGTRGGILVRHVFPADGEYVFSARLLQTVAEGYAGVEGHERPHRFVLTVDGERVFTASVGGPEDHWLSVGNVTAAKPEIDRRLTSPRVVVSAGAHEIGFTWMETPALEQAVWQPSLRASQGGHNASGLPRLRTVNIEGPYNVTPTGDTPSRARLFVCRPATIDEEPACARRIISTLAQRAFRRPVSNEDLAAPLEFYEEERRHGGDFESGIRSAVERVLISPAFLFRLESDPSDAPAGSPHLVSEIELASRLSFFLWSSIPDDELLDLAAARRLREPGVLQAQVRRMVADRRADALVSSFAGQWLQLRSLERTAVPSLLQFPDFDDNVRQAFRHETELLFSSILRGNSSVLDLLDADYTFVNERLARHYGIPGVYGSRFRRVQVVDQNRRGLLGHGSILSLTSVGTRTSPVIRGVYVLSNFLSTPPLPPPPNVPQLEESHVDTRPMSVREQLERHRANPFCGSCHRNMDPIGFALENFDVDGRWRDTENGLRVQPDGVLADGTRVTGPSSLRRALLARPDVFAGTVAERLLTYAIGRGLEAPDMAAVRGIVRTARQNEYGLLSLVQAIVESAPFQMRTVGPAAADTPTAQDRLE